MTTNSGGVELAIPCHQSAIQSVTLISAYLGSLLFSSSFSNVYSRPIRTFIALGGTASASSALIFSIRGWLSPRFSNVWQLRNRSR